MDCSHAFLHADCMTWRCDCRSGVRLIGMCSWSVWMVCMDGMCGWYVWMVCLDGLCSRCNSEFASVIFTILFDFK